MSSDSETDALPEFMRMRGFKAAVLSISLFTSFFGVLAPHSTNARKTMSESALDVLHVHVDKKFRGLLKNASFYFIYFESKHTRFTADPMSVAACGAPLMLSSRWPEGSDGLGDAGSKYMCVSLPFENCNQDYALQKFSVSVVVQVSLRLHGSFLVRAMLNVCNPEDSSVYVPSVCILSDSQFEEKKAD